VYAWAHAVIYGRPWRQHCPLGDPIGGERPDEQVARAKEKLAALDAVLTPEQRLAVANVAVFGFVPPWLWADRLGLRSLPEDIATRDALVTGLERLTRV
jgi:hypothetical protein